MSKLRVHGFTLSLDGYGAGPNQDLDRPLGVGGHELHQWAFATRTFQQMFGADGGSTGIDDEFGRAASRISGLGLWDGICSDRSGDPGPTTAGKVGGVTIRRTTLQSSSLPTTRAHRSP